MQETLLVPLTRLFLVVSTQFLLGAKEGVEGVRGKVVAKVKEVKEGGNPPMCSFCGKSGHLVDTCYKKHGYPPHLKQKYGDMCNTLIIPYYA